MKHLNYIYMILAALCLATIGVLVKKIGSAIPVMSLNFLRLFIGFITLLIIVPFIDKKWYKITGKDAREFFLIGVVYAISLSLYTAANIFAPVQNAVLINYSYPFFVLLFGYFILKEKVTRTKIITLLIAFVGLAIINPFEFGKNNLGNLLALAGAFFYGLMIVEMRKEDESHGIGDVVWFLFFASLVTLPFPLMNGLGNISSVWIYVVLLGAVSTGLAYILYNLALEKIEAEIGSIIATIITPLVSIILAIVLIGEQIHLRTIIGGALLILSGIYLETHNKKNKSKK
jgi:drug/metabolite transporter (DMT)-like permease